MSKDHQAPWKASDISVFVVITCRISFFVVVYDTRVINVAK